MAKDMYQKRKERKEKAMSNDNVQNGVNKTVINWDNPTDRKPLTNPDKIRICTK